MARINVEQKALTDPRFQSLATILGVSRQHVLGCMVQVWNECQERETYYLERHIVDAIFGIVGASKCMATVALGVHHGRHLMYIKGSRGRVEWLQKRRQDGKRGGRPKDIKGLTLGFDEKQRPDNPPAPAPAPALEKEDPPTPRQPEVEAKPAPPPIPSKAEKNLKRNGAYVQDKRSILSPEQLAGIESYRVKREELQAAVRSAHPNMLEAELLILVTAELKRQGITA